MASSTELGSAAPSLMLLDLPSEVILHILSFLDAKDLCRIGSSCRALRDDAEVDSLWREVCRRRWENKQLMVHEVFWRANFNHEATTPTLTVSEMKQVLRQRHIPVAGVLREKSELIGAIRRPCADVIFSTPLRGKWKASYAAAELDSRRTSMTMEELTSCPWKFSFKQQPEFNLLARFTRDFRYESEEHNFDWRFYSNDCIQVAQFPPLHMSRKADDWGWQMENVYVTFVMAPDMKGMDTFVAPTRM